MSDDRISQLSKRFKTHSVGRTATTSRNRERKSFYIDADLVKSIDDTYRKLNHELYPNQVSKSTFLESLIQFGLDHLPEVKATLPAEDGAE
jgi:hypothetical protein